ncbi:1,2-phenylacetyl-CoA epoxidase subunit PaaC [Pedococcus dokdonensis]|uniref:1,2-phenylacetyl-CoA epoxidase subunit PaaC n=1 Tax=Pedococcus dokdonensis TaxID=443156 RepID=UPI0022B25AD3|nr:1,2-phenylacetyl-CoA epoxidase subunit PaaC [Pedococcus dokdonensis]
MAFFRDAGEFRNARLVELDNGDFAVTIVKLLLFSSARIAVFEQLVDSRDHVLSAVAAKGVKELTYHRDYAGRWFLTLARGTAESRRRIEVALRSVWPLRAELFATHEVEARVAQTGVGVDPSTVADAVAVVLAQVFALSGVEQPDVAPMAAVQGRQGRDGMHTEALSRILGELQVVARAHPMGRW